MDDLTEGVKTLLGDPRKAIMKLALPMIIGLSAQTVYNVADAIWVSGLGADALAAVGFFFPFFFLLMALATGISVGGSSAISRKIGSRDKKKADSVAIHSLIIGVITAIAVGLPFFVLSDDIFNKMGAGRVSDMATGYARILFGGSIFIFFSNIANGILRGEGNAKRAMYALLLGSILNIILDPIFIYTFNLGVEGAAWATLLSIITTSVLLFNWLFLRKDTYVSIRLRSFRFKWEIIKEVLKVGIPASVVQLSMSLSILALNIIVVKAGGTDGVAVFTTGWRVVMIGTLPLLGMATAVTAITGAAYGARDFKKLDTAYIYAIKIGFLIEAGVALFTYAFAPWIAVPFTYSQGAAHIADDLILFLRTITMFYPFVAFGMFSSAMFQGIGKGVNSLAVTLLRTIVLTTPLAYLFSLSMDFGLEGVWMGIVAGNIMGAITAFVWGRLHVRGLLVMERESIAMPVED